MTLRCVHLPVEYTFAHAELPIRIAALHVHELTSLILAYTLSFIFIGILTVLPWMSSPRSNLVGPSLPRYPSSKKSMTSAGTTSPSSVPLDHGGVASFRTLRASGTQVRHCRGAEFARQPHKDVDSVRIAHILSSLPLFAVLSARRTTSQHRRIATPQAPKAMWFKGGCDLPLHWEKGGTASNE